MKNSKNLEASKNSTLAYPSSCLVYTSFPQVRGILEVLEEYRREGFRVPQIAYYTNTKSGETVNEIYEDLYKPGLYPELWFRWEGKPFIIGAKEECTPEQQEFFTFRAPQWPTEHKKPLACPWIDFERPQLAWTVPDLSRIHILLSQRPDVFRHRGRDPQLRGGDLPPNQRNHIPRHARRKGYLMRR